MNKYIVYISKEELLAFESSDSLLKYGISYEWEGENVVHLHFSPVLHSFGKTGTVVFAKNADELQQTGEEWQVLVTDNNNIKVVNTNSPSAIMDVEFIPAKVDLYSRNKGLLEIGILEKKSVAIIGLGSFGSQISVELAKAGVGEFYLFDFDRVELHNLARHICTTKDLGRLKTDAIEEAILGKNPYAKVRKYPVDINEHLSLLDEVLPNVDLVICATDNNQSRFTLSRYLHPNNKICIFGRAITRAEGGDVFIYRPGGACYNCLVGNIGNIAEEITNEESARRNGTIAAYVSPEDANAMVQVGLSADIEPICNMMVKLALVELSRGSDSGIKSLEDELVYNYYMWANRRERKYANWHILPGAGAMPTIMRWYGAHIKRLDDCVTCSSEISLDTGDEFEEMLNNLPSED